MLEGDLLPSFPSAIMLVFCHQLEYSSVYENQLWIWSNSRHSSGKKTTTNAQLWEIQTEMKPCYVPSHYDIGLKIWIHSNDGLTANSSISVIALSSALDDKLITVSYSTKARYSYIFRWEDFEAKKEITHFLRSFVLWWSEHLPLECGFLSLLLFPGPAKIRLAPTHA